MTDKQRGQKSGGQAGENVKNVYVRIANCIFSPHRRAMRLPSLSSFLVSPSFLLPFPRDPFSIQYQCIRSFLSRFVRFSLSSVLAFSCRYRYYLKPHRVSTVLEMRDVGIENANDSFLYTKASVSFIIRLWTTWRVSWICRYCTIRKSSTAKMT